MSRTNRHVGGGSARRLATTLFFFALAGCGRGVVGIIGHDADAGPVAGADAGDRTCAEPCSPGQTCLAGRCATCLALESGCTDGLDDDCDGLTDCADADCAARACDDARACTTGDRCGAGACSGVVTCGSAPGDCFEPAGQCDAEGACVYVARAADAACADDRNPCTADRCDGSGVCRHSPLADGAPCGAAGQTCSAGACGCGSASSEVSCIDGADDDCDGLTDCADPDCDRDACDDGSACTTGEVCQAGTCLGGTARACVAPPGPCYAATGTCDPASGACRYAPVADGTPCAEDGNGCTSDVCAAGTCTHPALANGTACDDGRACTGGDRCSNGLCVGSVACDAPPGPCAQSAGQCDASGACTYAPRAAGVVCRAAAGSCDAAESCDGTRLACPADTLLAAGTVCRASAGACDTAESCDGTRALCPGDAFSPAGTACPDDGNPCTSDRCDAAGSCAHPRVASGTACDDGMACTTGETCNDKGLCQGGTVACDLPPGECYQSPGTCDASNQCTYAAKALGTACGTCRVCGAGDSCGVAPNGTACGTGMACASGTCAPVPDTTAPSTPTGLRATAAGSTSIALSWTASTDAGGSGLQGYNVYRDGALVKIVLAPSTSVTDDGLAPASAHTYTISAVDNSQNESARSAPASATTSAAGTDCSSTPADRAAAVCQRWACDRLDRSEGTWTGSAATCTAGDMGAPGRANALKMINLYRFLAQLPAVTTDATRNAKAQQCALMMSANGALSHSPPTSWKCYTSDGAQAAGSSNIASTRAVAAIDLYMQDSGNATTIGHRRWLLSNSLGPVGIGGATYSCHWVIGGSGNAGRAWTAWPPQGPVPLAALSGVDGTGWTIQSDSINLGSARVEVRDAGTLLPVTVTALGANYGSAYAIRFNPSGWTTQAGHTYAVTVTGISPTISYSVSVLACP